MVHIKRVLKLGDSIYSQSLQQFDKSYLTGFPQREQQLFKLIKKLDFSYFKHQNLNTFEKVKEEKNKFNRYLSENSKYDYILIDNPLSILLIDESINIPIVFDCIDWYDEMYLKEFGVNKGYYLLRYAYCEVLDRANYVVAQSPVILESLKKWGLKTSKSIVIPNGYNKKIFFPYDKNKINKVKEALSKQYNTKFKDQNIIVYTGKLGKWYEDILLVAQEIDQNSLFLIVGDGPILGQIPNSPNIIKCGVIPLEKVADFTNIADVLVFPVSIDCSPIAISEYLAVGKPIVMGKGRIEWLLKNGENGVLIDNTEKSWRRGIKEALSIKEKAYTLNIKKSKTLSWQKLAKDFEMFLE